MKFNCDPTLENNNLDFFIVFNDAPYTALNDYKFDVKNIQADTGVAVFGSTKTEITFDLIYKKSLDKNNNFTHWFKDIYSSYCGKLNVTFNPYYANNAIIYMNDGNTGKLIRKWTLFKVFPIGYANEYSDEYNTLSFKAILISVEDLTEDEKKANDEKETNSILNKVQQYVKLISKLDDVEKYIDENKLPSFESAGKEFTESLKHYNNFLKDTCIDIMKELYK